MPASAVSQAPVSVTLTAGTPVAVFEVEAHPQGLPQGANILAPTLTLHQVDPRIRVAVARESFAQGAGELAPIARPGTDGELELTGLDRKSRITIELTEARPSDSVKVSGELSDSAYWDGAPDAGASIAFTGLDRPDLREAPDVRTSTAAGPKVVLDADHPVALVPMTLVLDQAGELGGMATETRITPAPAVPGGAATASIYTVAGAGTSAYPVPVPVRAPIDCWLGTQAPCGGPMVLRWQWTGSVPRVEVRYDVATTLVGYAGPVGSRVRTTFDAPITVAPPATPLRAAQQGTLDVNPSIGGIVIYDLALAGVPASPIPEVLEVPGLVVATLSASGPGGAPVAGASVGVRFPNMTSGRTAAAWPDAINLPADGTARTVVIPAFAACVPGSGTCGVEITLSAGVPRGAGTTRITVSYRLDARVTAFSGAPLGPGTRLSLTPRVPAPSQP